VLETHHCTVAISVLAKDAANIFHSFDEHGMNAMWPIFLQPFLATDMSTYFDIIDELTRVIRTKEKSQTNPKEN
jgi:serine/threonine-protein kinase RIO1